MEKKTNTKKYESNTTNSNKGSFHEGLKTLP